MKAVPVVTLLCPQNLPHADLDAVIERRVIGRAARVRPVAVPLHPSAARIAEVAGDASAVILWHSVVFDRAVIRGLRRCRAIIRNGVGFDSVDLKAASARKIAVCNVPDYGTEEVADHAIALALALCRQLFPLDAEAKRLGWRIEVAGKLRRLRTLTFGVVGLGRIGTAAALRAKALGFRVVFHDPYVRSGVQKAIGVERLASLEALLKQSDVVSIHCPLSDETRGLIGARELRLMRRSAFLVNTARGDIVRKAPLLEALRRGQLSGAGMDVMEDEPLRTPEEADTPNLIVTCHSAFCSREAVAEMRTTSARIARAAALGEPVWNRVN